MDTQNFNPETMVNRPEPKGPVFGIIIIIILLILGGVYVFMTGGQIDEPVEDNVAEELSSQGTSTDIGSIEADVMSTDLEGLDDSFDSLEAEVTAE